MSLATALAAAAGGLVALGVAGITTGAPGAGVERAVALIRLARAPAERVLQPLRRAGVEGTVPTDRERFRLQLAAGAAGLGVGSLVVDVLAGAALAVALAWLASRALVWRHQRYRRRLDVGASSAAIALADALAAGHSVRGALVAAGPGLGGPIGNELRRVARELELGTETDLALERLRARARSRRVDLIVAAVRVQRRSGGSLATLLRGIAATIDDQDRLEAEARAASAQARFTSMVVVLLPLLGLLLGELVAPGIIDRMTGSVLGVWLLGVAVVLLLGGLLLIRRLGRVDG